MDSKSECGDNIALENAGWRFSGEMVETFDKHIARSIPWYSEGHDLICQFKNEMIIF